MKPVCVVAVYTVCMLILLSWWPGMYWVWVCVEVLITSSLMMTQ